MVGPNTTLLGYLIKIDASHGRYEHNSEKSLFLNSRLPDICEPNNKKKASFSGLTNGDKPNIQKNRFSYWVPNKMITYVLSDYFQNAANNMAINRMNTLMEFVSQISFKQTTNGQQQQQNATLPWLDISSLIFGTYMVHRVINEQAKEDYKFGQNPWFESFLFNFGEVCDRIKLFALLQDNGYSIFQQYLYLLVIRSPSRMAISRSYPSHFFNSTQLDSA